MRQVGEMMCNGEFLNKDPDGALDCFDLLAKNAQSWDTTDTSNRSRASTDPSWGGKYQLRNDDNLSARVASITRKLEAMELWKVKESILCLKLTRIVEFVRTWNTLPMNVLQF